MTTEPSNHKENIFNYILILYIEIHVKYLSDNQFMPPREHILTSTSEKTMSIYNPFAACTIEAY